jgi:hypothetical protein
MRQHRLASASLALLLAAGGCASAGTPKTSKSSPDRITTAEIEATSASSAYDVISQLHPDWLRPPAKAAMSGALGATQSGTRLRTPLVVVYLDGVRYGGTDQLRSLSSSVLTSIEFVGPSRIAMVVRDLGTPAPDAAIMVSTKR